MKQLPIVRWPWAGLLIVLTMLMAACAPPAVPVQPAAPAPAEQAPAEQPAAQTWPDYYPADYGQLVEGCQSEGKLLIYSIMSERNWAPVIEAFQAQYGGIEIEALDLGSYEVFERYYAEAASNARTGDIIITSAPDAWQDFIAKGEVVDYKSPEHDNVPEWSRLAPGIYTVSSDPMVFIWNKQLIDNPPKTMAELAQMVEANPDAFQGKLTTYDAESVATGFAINWFWIKKNGDAGWAVLDTLGKTGVFAQSSAGRMVDSTLAGEASIGYFVSTISVLTRFPDAEPVLGWGLIGDGQPILVRGMGITRAASSPNCAKLMLDFILSQEGQIAFAKGGLTPYRSDIAEQVDLHYQKLAAEIGEENMIPFYFDPDLTDQAKKDAFVARWKQAMGR